MVRVVRNGVSAAEFEPVIVNPDATDFVCIGELRPVKAVDVLIEALAILKASGRAVTATIVGEGPEEARLKALTHERGLADEVRFVGFQPARTAFAMGRMLAIPSRAESLPYVVLEAAAAGLPIVATEVGGVPEIFGEYADTADPARRRDRPGECNPAIARRPRTGEHCCAENSGAGPRRVLGGYDGGRRARGLSRSPSAAQAFAVRITNF